MLKIIKYIFYSPVDILLLLIGIGKFRKNKVNSTFSYKSMLRLYFIYGDIILKFVNSLTKENINNFEKKITHKSKNITKICKNIHEDGFYVKKNFLDEVEIEELKKLIYNYEYKLRLTDKNISSKYTHQKYKSKFDPINPKAVLYEFDSNFLINQKVIQKILLKDEILEIGKKYFGSSAFLDHVSLSITANYNHTPDSNAAQLYHYDLDRPNWLKFLTYVNDVNYLNGPHCFLKETHKYYAIPFKMRSKGYVRFSDDDKDLKKFKINEKIITGKAGTSIIESTKGFHKGEVVKSGYRILLNIQINSSMFGSPYKVAKFENISDDLKKKFLEKKEFFKYSTNLLEVI